MAEDGGRMEIRDMYKGGLILLIGFIFLKLGGVIFRVICMRFLPVESYGEVAVFLVLFNWFVLFATLNVTIGLAKFVSQDPGKKRLFYSSALVGTTILSLFVSAVLFILSPIISEALNMNTVVMVWAIGCVPFAVIYNIGIFYFRGNFRMGSSTKADIVMMVIRIAILLALIYVGLLHAPYIAFIISFMAIDIFILLKEGGFFETGIKEAMTTYRILLIYSIPIFVSEFLRLFSMGFDRLALSAFYTTAEAGIYDVGVSLCLGYMIIANSYSNALLPMASKSHNDTKKRKSALMKSLKASTILFILYTALLLVAGRPVIELINPAYMGVFDFILPLSIAYIMIGFLTILYFFANSVGLQKYALYSGAVFAFLSLFLNSYLVPSMLYTGAVISLMTSAAASLTLIGALIWNTERKL